MLPRGGRTGFLKKIRRRKKQDDARPTQSTCKTGPNIEVAIIFRSEIVPPGPAKITTQTDRQTDRLVNPRSQHAAACRFPSPHWTNHPLPLDRGKPANGKLFWDRPEHFRAARPGQTSNGDKKKPRQTKRRRGFSLTPLQFYPGQNVREMFGTCSGNVREVAAYP